MFRINFATTDDITSEFTRTIDKLERHSQKRVKQGLQLDAFIESLATLRKAFSNDAVRAKVIKAKLEALIA